MYFDENQSLYCPRSYLSWYSQSVVKQSKQKSTLLKQTNQLLVRAESAEAKLAEEQKHSANLVADNVAS